VRGCERPGAEAAHAQAGQVNEALIHSVLANNIIPEGIQRIAVPAAPGALGRHQDEREVGPLFDCCHVYRLDPHPKSIHPPTIMINATPTQLRKAADIQEKIQSLQEELGQLLGGLAETAAIQAPRKRKVSPAGIARMRAAQKARWAKIKGTAPSAKPAQKPKRKMSAQGLANIRAGVRKRMMAQAKGKAVQKPKRKMSAAGLANIRAAQKARWAKAKKAG